MVRLESLYPMQSCEGCSSHRWQQAYYGCYRASKLGAPIGDDVSRGL